MSAQILPSMRALQAALDRFDRQAATRMGLGRNDAAALRLLVEHGPATPAAIMAELAITSGSVTALLDRLERAGLAHRRAHESDRRSLVVEASEAGRGACEQAFAPLGHLTGKLAARMDDARGQAVTRQLDNLSRLVNWASGAAS
ncbi:MAG: hypothetical protein CL955_02405 [Erythrobacteraceae bacterium]|nr:hypothetical protein [Erythrobacteraceae bacterium]